MATTKCRESHTHTRGCPSCPICRSIQACVAKTNPTDDANQLDVPIRNDVTTVTVPRMTVTVRPRWAWLTLLGICTAAGLVYGWGLSRMQLNLYYSAGVKTMSEDWSAFFLGAYDPARSITLDKIPGAFWPSALSARVFGFHSWAVLLPIVLVSVATIPLLYRLVSRWLGTAAGVGAALFFATTPLVAAVARSEVPDSLLVFLVVAAAVAWQAAIRGDRLPWLVICGVLIGLAFQVKMAQAWLMWPVFVLIYLFAGPASWAKRAVQAALASVAMLVVSLSWVVAMALTPAASRPYVDGSVDNSALSMVFGYNGINRYGIANDGTQGLGIGGPIGRDEGPVWLYLFRDSVAPQIGWLYPLALAGIVLCAARLGRWQARLTHSQADYLMWTLWLVLHVVAFGVSVKAHTFYAVALAPSLAALAGAGSILLWQAYRSQGWQRWLLPATVAATTVWTIHLSNRVPAFEAWQRPAVAIAGTLAVAALVIRRLPRATAAASLAAVLLAPLVWTFSVLGHVSIPDAHRPAAGPSSRELGTVLQGRMPRLLPAAEVDRVTDYLRAHASDGTYQVAVPWAPQAGQFIRRGLSALPVGGFTAQVPNVTPQRLQELVDRGELRYAMVDGPAAKGMITPDYAAYAPWVRSRCRPVSGFTGNIYQLYDCDNV